MRALKNNVTQTDETASSSKFDRKPSSFVPRLCPAGTFKFGQCGDAPSVGKKPATDFIQSLIKRTVVPMYDPQAFRLNDQVAVVTGAGAGIGRAVATTFAAAVVSDRDYASAQTVAEEIHAAGGQASAVACDVTRETDLEQLVQTALTEYRRLTTLGPVAVWPDAAPAAILSQDKAQCASCSCAP